MSSTPNPHRGEVWLVKLDPTEGDEMKKTRPCVVVSSDGVGKLAIKLVVPLTEWADFFARNIWHVKVEPDKENGLDKTDAADCLQVRGVSLDRFKTRKGRVSQTIMDEITAAIAAIIEHQ